MLLQPPVVPRNGHTLRVLMICRVSDPRPGKQDERSNADQEALHRRWLETHCDVPYEATVISGTGSGEHLDRDETRRAYDALESGQFDLVLAEDLGRIFRRAKALDFCEVAEDCQARVIAPNDHVDTAQPGWRMNAFFAAMRHEMYNADTASRIRRSLRNRFANGSIFLCEIYGYIKPHPDCTDDDVSKEPAAEPVYERWFKMLEDGATYAEVADYLNAQAIPTGKHCDLERWSGRMVARLTHNPLLKGIRQRNKYIAKRVNSTGHRRSIKAPPEELLERTCPHLAFIEPARYDRVIRLLAERNQRYRRKGRNGVDPRANVSRKRTRWPGQHVLCGICGYRFCWGGHGQTDHLMCDGCRDYRCWMGASVDGPLAASKMLAAILSEVENLPAFDESLVGFVRRESDRLNDTRGPRLQEITRSLSKINRQLVNLVDFVAANRIRPESIGNKIVTLEAERSRLEQEQRRLESEPTVSIQLPSVDAIRALARQALDGFDSHDQSFGRLLRNWIPRIVVFPFQLLDGGPIVLRARFRLQLHSLVPQADQFDPLRQSLERIVEVDLFDPPQREAFRPAVVRLRSQGNSERAVADELGITITAAQRAARLQRQMDELGITDPYVSVAEPPTGTRLKRHQNHRYRFAPLDEAGHI